VRLVQMVAADPAWMQAAGTPVVALAWVEEDAGGGARLLPVVVVDGVLKVSDRPVVVAGAPPGAA
jgi:hypothetical protein